MVIITIVFVSGFLIFSTITERISKQSANKVISSSATDFIFFIRHKLKEAIIQDIDGPFRIDFVGTETSIRFVAPYTKGEGSDIGKYGLYLADNEIRLSFERIDRKTESYSFDTNFSGSQVLVENVKRLSFSYWNGKQWEKLWDTRNQIGQASLPDKIRVMFTLIDRKFEGKEIERTYDEEIWMGK